VAFSHDRVIRNGCLSGQIVYGTLKYPCQKKDQGRDVNGRDLYALNETQRCHSY
jgi:hypothetical protein